MTEQSQLDQNEKQIAPIGGIIAQAAGPALIMCLVGSLLFFFIEVFYHGGYNTRVLWIFGLFVFAAVLVSRISIELGKDRAYLYGLALGAAIFIVTSVLFKFEGPLSFLSPLINLALICLVWWSAAKLTWDCTLVDNSRDTSAQGLIELVRRKARFEDTGDQNFEQSSNSDVDNSDSQSEVPANPFKWLFKKSKNSPGLWVLYFSAAALPIFGLGQVLIPVSNTGSRQFAFMMFVVYMMSALGLLMTTSLLSLSRYVISKRTVMPLPVFGNWLVIGSAFVVAILTASWLIPRPAPEHSMAQTLISWTTPDRDPSKYAIGNDGKKTADDVPANSTEKNNDALQSSSSGNSEKGKPGKESGGKSGSGKGKDPKGGSSSNKDKQNSGKKSQQNSDQRNDSGQRKKPEGSGNNQNKNGQQNSGDSQKSKGESNSGSKESKENRADNDGKNENSDQSKTDETKESNADGEKKQDSESDKRGQDTTGKSGPEKPNNKKNPGGKSGSSASSKSKSQSQSSSARSNSSSSKSQSPNPANIVARVFSMLKYIMIGLILLALVVITIMYRKEIMAALKSFWEQLMALFSGKPKPDEDSGNTLDELATAERFPAFAEFTNPFQTSASRNWEPDKIVNYSFAALQAWARERDIPRQTDQTAIQFGEIITAKYQQASDVIDDGIQLYCRINYAGKNASPGDLPSMEKLWRFMNTAPLAEPSAPVMHQFT